MRAPAVMWIAIGAAVLGLYPVVDLQLNSPGKILLFQIGIVVWAVSMTLLVVRAVRVALDRRVVILDDDGIRFLDLNLRYFTIPWSQVRSIDVGDYRQYSFVNFINSEDRRKSKKLPLQLLDTVICERFINALRQRGVDVQGVERG